jgi:hypothetical protein
MFQRREGRSKLQIVTMASPTRSAKNSESSFWIAADFAVAADGKATELVIDGRKGVRVPDGASK